MKERHNSGLGQHIDLSAQASTLQASQTYMVAKAINAPESNREAGGVTLSDIYIPADVAVRDGHVSVTVLFGPALGPFTRRLMEWIHEEGFCDEETLNKDWLNYADLLFSGTEPVEEYERVKQCVANFCMTKTKQELFDAAFEKRLLIAPVTTAEDVYNNPHLEERGLWEDVIVNGHEVRYPGRMAIFSETPQIPLLAPPAIGEHTVQVLSEPKPRALQFPLVPDRRGKPRRVEMFLISCG